MAESQDKTELTNFTNMLQRVQIPYSTLEDDNCIEIELAPQDNEFFPLEDGEALSPNLTGQPWATSTFKFSKDGCLLSIDMQGD